jgi:hypothetical protein
MDSTKNTTSPTHPHSYLPIFSITKIHIFKLSIQNKLKGSKSNKQWTAPKTPPVPHILNRPILSRVEALASNPK